MEVFLHYCFLWLTLDILVNFPFIGSPAFIVLTVKWEPLSSADTFRIPVLEDSYVLGNLLHFPHQPQFCSASSCRPRKRSPAALLPPLSIILVDLYASYLLMEVLKIHFIMFRDGFPFISSAQDWANFNRMPWVLFSISLELSGWKHFPLLHRTLSQIPAPTSA